MVRAACGDCCWPRPAETQMLFMGDRAVHAGNGERRRRDTGQGVEDFHGPALG